LLVEWNRTRVAFPAGRCFHRLFEEQVERRGDATAASCGADRLSYRQLNDRANRLAHHLRSLGVGPETRVGIYLERSLEMLVGLLGVLKAGAAYVPLDPAYPRERISYMLEDAAAPLLITRSELLADWAPPGITPLCLDLEREAIARQSSRNPALALDAAHLAYTIYTSGSTGRPKGVEISHRALVNFLNAMRVRPGLSEGDVLLAVTTISFDIAALELYLPLLVGARLVLMTRVAALDGTQLLAELHRSGATVMQATPATWRLLLAAGWQETPGLKILCGGEAMSGDLARQLLSRGASVWNLYGPTETTIWSTLSEVTAEGGVVPGEALQPIGRPIDNTRIYILDQRLQPVPVGIPGALFIGGDGLARGYRRQPALSAAKFIPDPFSDQPGARMYETGDLARYTADGGIEFLGRLDHQVKIRGFRIEVGEIEAVLAKHPAVRDKVVVARREPDGDQRLVAYLILDQAGPPTTSDLRAFVQTQLPDYMVPALFERLAAFPMTPNGKIDRKALPEPRGQRPELDAEFRIPQTGLEKQIAEIWQQVLQVDRIGIRDNFFDLGGHSLLMVKIHQQLQKNLGEELNLVELFQYPTIEELAQRLSAGSAAGRVKAAAGRDRAKAREEGQAMRTQRQRLRRSHRVQLNRVDEEQ
jgi:amino acid adenylation domain-containing protein